MPKIAQSCHFIAKNRSSHNSKRSQILQASNNTSHKMYQVDYQYNKNQPAKSHSATSAATAKMGLDDYGECDLSLASYKRDPISSQTALSLEEAHKRLYERLKEYPPFTKGQTIEHTMTADSYSPAPHNSYTFTAGPDVRISVQIRSDVQRVFFSTVVHKEECRQRDQFPPKRRSYSLLTKMMKYNAILPQTIGGGRVITSGEGSFIFFQDMNMMDALCCTIRCRELADSVADFVLKATEIRRDFDRTTTSKKAQKRQNFGRVH
jgi:hypothetical protein